MRLELIILAAAGLALAACAPEAPVETPADAASAPAEPAADTARDPAPADEVRAYFEANFSGRWGMDASCAEEGLFRLTPDQLTLYERRCDVVNLTRDGAMIAARTQCAEEGRPMAENTTMLTPVSEDTITVSDGHYEWTRVACGPLESETQGAPQ